MDVFNDLQVDNRLGVAAGSLAPRVCGAGMTFLVETLAVCAVMADAALSREQTLPSSIRIHTLTPVRST